MKSRVLIADNVFVRMFVLERAGDEHDGHAHTFDHITLLAAGSVEMLTQLGVEPPLRRNFTAPSLIVTPKGLVHQFIALTDACVLACVHAIRNGDGLDDIAPDEVTPDEARELLTRYPLARELVSIADGRP